MRMNLSVDGNDFKSQIKALREKLNECRATGILNDDDFEEQLCRLSKAEEKLLSELIPYYRVYADNIRKTAMRINPAKQWGAFNFDSFLQAALRINKNLYIAGSIDRKVQFFYINTADDISEHRIEEEWSPPIKEINETISYIYKLNDKEIMLFGVSGGCYLLSCDNFDQLPDVNGQIKVRRIRTDNYSNGFGRCLPIEGNLFVAENEDEKINLLEIIKEDGEYRLVFHKDICCTVPNWTVFEKLDDDYFVAGTKDGKLYFVKYEDRQLVVTEEIDFLSEEIRQIKCLEDGNGKKNSILVTGNKGKLKIFNLYGDSKNIKTELKDLKGNLFDIQSENGTAVVLSEDGIIYLLEENFGNWYLNEEAAIKNVFYTNVLKFDISKYLIMDVEGRLNLLHIDRINTPKDLWNVPLYQ